MKSFDLTCAWAAEQRLDDAQWQRATNEGWPDRPRLQRPTSPLGQITPRTALMAPSKTYNSDVLQSARRSDRQGVRFL